MITDGWVKLAIGRDTEEVMRDPGLFALLSLIALNVKFDDSLSLRGLRKGQAFIRNPSEAGLTRKEYRNRLAKLCGLGLIDAKTTNRGTIVTLLRTTVFDPYAETAGQQGAIGRPTRGHQVTSKTDDRSPSLFDWSSPASAA